MVLLANLVFTVKWDDHGFYIELGRKSGCSQHQGHPRVTDTSLLPLPSRLLTLEEKEAAKQVAVSSCPSTARNFVFTHFRKFLSRAKMAWLASKEKGPGHDDISRMLARFEKSEEVRFTTISDVPTSELRNVPADQESESSVLLSTTKTEAGDIINSNLSTHPSAKGLVDRTRLSRRNRKIRAKQYQFVSIAWTILPVFRYFLLCPEVIWCDVTSHTNNKGYMLLTFTCRTSLSRQVVFMWVWIPNEQRMSFRWVFQLAIPKLLPAHARRRVRFIMKDGDPQQRNELLSVLLPLFPNAREGSCGWHIGEL